MIDACFDIMEETNGGNSVTRIENVSVQQIDRFPKVEGAGGDVHIGTELSKLFNVTDKLAQQRDDQYISSEL